MNTIDHMLIIPDKAADKVSIGIGLTQLQKGEEKIVEYYSKNLTKSGRT